MLKLRDFAKKYYKLATLVVSLFIMLLLFLTNNIAFPLKVTLQGKEKCFFAANKILKYDIEVPTASNIDIVSGEDRITIIPQNKGETTAKVKLFGLLPLKNINISVVSEEKIYALGNAVGIRLYLGGLLVEATAGVDADDGLRYYPAKDRGLRKGDIILEANGKSLKNSSDLLNIVYDSNGMPIELKCKRNGEEIIFIVDPVYSNDRKYHIGLWIKDTINGIGTLTFASEKDLEFGALGHGITESTEENVLPINGGEVFETEISGIKKGQKGIPGELKGNLLMKYRIIGEVKQNTQYGIFGIISGKYDDDLLIRKYSIGYKEMVKEGDGYILSNIEGSKVEKFSVEIQRIIMKPFGSPKGMIIKITDKRLIDKTGGIVQGMSGSPIIQNERIIGAVTHVLINEPLRGYGVFIENMLAASEISAG